MAAVVTVTRIVMTISRSSPAIARIGIAVPIVLAIGIREMLGAPARIGDYVLRRCRIDRTGQE
jgi:hypothetical protein